MGVMETFAPAGSATDFPPDYAGIGAGIGAASGIDAAAVDEIGRAGAPLRAWPAAVRALYREEVIARLYREEHLLFLLGLLVCLATIAIDIIVNPAMVREGLLLRLLAVAPITLLGLIAGVRRWPQTLAFCVGASPIAFMAVIIHLSLYLPPEYAARYLVATVLVVGLGNIMLPYSLRGLLVYDGSAILVAMAVLAANDSAGLLNYLDYLILLALVGAATLPIAHRYESLRQHNFLLNLRARIVSHELFNANQALHILSESDPLTGIANRRCFEREFDELVAASRAAAAYSEQDRIAVMMIDLDYFKSFNDTHGHQAGDACLCLVANSLQSLFDEAGGIVARYGGEEFIAAFCVTDTGTAQTLGEEVRETIATVLMPVSEQDRSLVTASIGVGIAPVAADLPREELIEMADAALYSAKGRGRNRVEWTEAEIAFSRGV